MLEAAREAVARARAGQGPTFIEALTYRLRGHYEGDPGKYRELSELADWKARDPIARFVSDVRACRGPSGGCEARARAVVDAATEAVLAAPSPSLDRLLTQVDRRMTTRRFIDGIRAALDIELRRDPSVVRARRGRHATAGRSAPPKDLSERYGARESGTRPSARRPSWA